MTTVEQKHQRERQRGEFHQFVNWPIGSSASTGTVESTKPRMEFCQLGLTKSPKKKKPQSKVGRLVNVDLWEV
ncbi:hypothetical protein OPV22_025806 [Ensete ventricosum]|uniref:Uncharacterized protein n=1 Tax=Ensete ventricosum TaxID=4639 RepID=A0AAV8QDN4_ENSVE|nr:hypothetical protein OPV22_025806 [Ensete ventricosum]